jgi:hypothetical protein
MKRLATPIAERVMKALSLALVTTVAALLAASASAADGAMAAGDLQQLCLGSDTTSSNVCRIYILGVVQGIEVGRGMTDVKIAGARPCIPEGTSAETLERSIRKKLDEDLAAAPSDRERNAAAIVGKVLARAFPCQKAGP